MDPLNAALGILDKYGLPIAALIAVSFFAWWVTRYAFRQHEKYEAELQQRLDRALDIGDRQVDATQELTAELHKALDNRGELMELLREAVGKLANRRT